MRTLRQVRADAELYGITDSELSRSSGVSRSSVTDALRGDRDTLTSTVEALSAGIDKVIKERRANAASILEGEVAVSAPT